MAEVHAVDEHIGVNDLVKNQVMVLGDVQAGQGDEGLQMHGVVVQVTGREETSPRWQLDARSRPQGGRRHRLGRREQDFDGHGRLYQIDRVPHATEA